MAKLDSLNQQVRSCRLCRLCRLRVNGVPGEGDAAAEVMFIGEAPGFHEDREGRPFVGPAGQFLDELLGLAGLDRKAVYITNVVKCRPPQNRDPLPDEQAACGPYLARQIATIDPLLIVTLGRYSMYHFFPDDKISAVHGQAREVDGRVVMMMLHPSYGLRSPEGRESLKTDFRKLPAVLTEARAARTRRAAPEPPVPIDVDALVAAHLRARPDLPPPIAPAPRAPEAPEDAYAYLDGVVPARKRAPGGRKAARPAAPEPALIPPADEPAAAREAPALEVTATAQAPPLPLETPPAAEPVTEAAAPLEAPAVTPAPLEAAALDAGSVSAARPVIEAVAAAPAAADAPSEAVPAAKAARGAGRPRSRAKADATNGTAPPKDPAPRKPAPPEDAASPKPAPPEEPDAAFQQLSLFD